MQFSYLEEICQKWRDILVIGKTIEHNNNKYHIIGMTLLDEARLYIIEPFYESEDQSRRLRGIVNHRKMLKNQDNSDAYYMHCSKFKMGDTTLQVHGADAGPLKYSLQDYGEIQLFLDMINAGWEIPEWLKYMEWDELQLVTLHIADIKELPEYSVEMPITIKHDATQVRHLLEKTLTLEVGKTRSFHFIDDAGEKVQCYINKVTLIDIWKDAEERFHNPIYVERFPKEQIEEIKEKYYEGLEQCCPKGLCYIGIEYECTKDISLELYSKEYLKSSPVCHAGGSSFLLMSLKPDEKEGQHNLPLKGSVIQTPVPPDTTKIQAEVFSYFEKIEAWEEVIITQK